MSFLLNPFVFAGAAGDFESIATVTVGAGGASSIQFTSIPGTYQHLQLRMLGRTDTTQSATDLGDVYIRLNADTGSNYAWHRLLGNGSTASASAGASATSIVCSAVTARTTAAANLFGALVVDILDYANTSKNTTVRNLGGGDLNGAGNIGIRSGLWANTSAVTAIEITFEGSNTPQIVQHSTAALYGIKAP